MDRVKFIEDSHQYIHDKGELISVSKFFEQFKEKVDWNLIAKRVAAKLTKNGQPSSAAQILKKWENKRVQSSKIGTLYHSIREQELIGEENPSFYDVFCNIHAPYHDGCYKLSNPINDLKNNTVYPELMIYDLDYMICGQSDKVIVTNNKINIWDYKTDKEISFKGFSNEWVKPKKLLDPLSHLDDCNGNHYSIKMSMYMYLLWKANKGRFKPGELIIEHVHLKRDPDNDDIPVLDELGKPIVLKIEKIKLPYRKKEVLAILNYGNR